MTRSFYRNESTFTTTTSGRNNIVHLFLIKGRSIDLDKKKMSERKTSKKPKECKSDNNSLNW